MRQSPAHSRSLFSSLGRKRPDLDNPALGTPRHLPTGLKKAAQRPWSQLDHTSVSTLHMCRSLCMPI